MMMMMKCNYLQLCSRVNYGHDPLPAPLFFNNGTSQTVPHLDLYEFMILFYNNNNAILIKREPLVHTRARRAVQKKKEEEKKARTVQQQ